MWETLGHSAKRIVCSSPGDSDKIEKEGISCLTVGVSDHGPWWGFYLEIVKGRGKDLMVPRDTGE